MADENKHLVLAFFDSEMAADDAVDALRQWDATSDAIKLGEIGLLVKDENGTVKTHKLGPRAGKKGVAVGAVLGILAAPLTGGLSLLGGVAGGAVLGGVVGSFLHAGLHISQDDLDRIGGELDAGHAAVCVLVESDEVRQVADQLKDLGGTPEAHEVAAGALEHAPVAPDASPAIETG